MIKLLPILLFLPGCSALFEQERTIVVTKSPYQIVLSGDVNFMDKMWASRTVNKLSEEEYILHKFEPTIVGITGSESSTHVTTDVQKTQEEIE